MRSVISIAKKLQETKYYSRKRPYQGVDNFLETDTAVSSANRLRLCKVGFMIDYNR